VVREVSACCRGLTWQELWIRYTLLRMEAARLFDRKPREGGTDYRSFFAETDYFGLRQMYYQRNSCFHWMANLLRQRGGRVPSPSTGVGWPR
jgi:hypothetical protein